MLVHITLGVTNSYVYANVVSHHYSTSSKTNLLVGAVFSTYNTHDPTITHNDFLHFHISTASVHYTLHDSELELLSESA